MDGPDIVTPRLALRRHRPSDYGDSLALWSDPEVTRFIGGRPFTPEEVWSRLLRYLGHWEALGFGYWVATDRATGRFVGEVGFADYRRAMTPPLNAPEAGWVLAPHAAGRGLATEAVAAALAWADRERDWPRTACIIRPGHAASERVAAKLGFALVGEATYAGTTTNLYERSTPA